MKKKDIRAIAQPTAKNTKTEEDVNEFRQVLTKITVEAALSAELSEHFGFDKHIQLDSDNNRDGVSQKSDWSTTFETDGYTGVCTDSLSLRMVLKSDCIPTVELYNC